MVAEAFIPNPDNKPQVNHRNGCKTDNRVENLEWCTAAENTRHSFELGLQVVVQGEGSPRSKFTNEQVAYIRDNPDELNTCELAAKFDVTAATISDIQLGRKYRNAGGNIREAKFERSIVPNAVRAEIRQLYVKGSRGCGSYALAEKFGVSAATILRIVHESKFD